MTRGPASSLVLSVRRAGVLLHPTSLPASFGALGAPARRFIDFLHNAGISVWQMLPVGPTHEDRSPYHSLSANAGNTELIDLEDLVACGWLEQDELHPAGAQRQELLEKASGRFFHHRQLRSGASQPDDYDFFLERNNSWLTDYALFKALRECESGAAWQHWPAPLRDRDPAALSRFRNESEHRLDQVRFEQFIFDRQWQSLRSYGRAHGVYLFGDIPIFVAHDSADVWSHRSLFKLDDRGAPEVVAGVPPDYFSSRGQHWGNPLYNWEELARDGFQWWLTRLEVQQRLFDLIRIDHFRGLVACWEIPAQTPEPILGHWVAVPGYKFLETCFKALPNLPLVAENLGLIGEDVESLRRSFGLPGMAVLQFGFDGNADNPHLNHNHRPGDVIYTGTHDNDTTLGWYQSLDERTRRHLNNYVGGDAEPMPWRLVRLAMQSVSRLAIVPMQDLLALGSDARLNTPGTAKDNWIWRFQWSQIDDVLPERVRQLSSLYGRLS